MPKISDERKLERSQQILDAARRCFIDKGFHRASMSDVIRESGLSAGAVYSYYSSKEELIAAVARSTWASPRTARRTAMPASRTPATVVGAATACPAFA